jgi:pSer/pThr/pTyr-binding forkhead associated (FHA) protein
VADPALEGRAFFERQQRRRQEAQSRLTGKPPPERLPATRGISPSLTAPMPRPDALAVPLRIVVTSGPQAGKAFGLRPGELVIGRGEGSPIKLDDTRVSHIHAVLRLRGPDVTIEDLHSTNGTAVNGALIERPTPLAPGDRIDAGGVELLLERC